MATFHNIFNDTNYTNSTNNTNSTNINDSSNDSPDTTTVITIFIFIIIVPMCIFVLYSFYNQPSEHDDIVSEYQRTNSSDSSLSRQKSEECVIRCEDKQIVES
jgi:ATP-dependent Zn protease